MSLLLCNLSASTISGPSLICRFAWPFSRELFWILASWTLIDIPVHLLYRHQTQKTYAPLINYFVRTWVHCCRSVVDTGHILSYALLSRLLEIMINVWAITYHCYPCEIFDTNNKVSSSKYKGHQSVLCRYMRPSHFPGWGRPFEFNAQLLRAMHRDEEARDSVSPTPRLVLASPVVSHSKGRWQKRYPTGSSPLCYPSAFHFSADASILMHAIK